jgi:hypothetical protein
MFGHGKREARRCSVEELIETMSDARETWQETATTWK